MESYFINQTSNREPVKLWMTLKDDSRFYTPCMMSSVIEDGRPHMHKSPSDTGG